MQTYVLLLRGINVGGKNKVAMTELRSGLETLGYTDVMTYIASGNVIARSGKDAGEVQAEVQAALSGMFKLDSELIRVLALSCEQFKAVIDNKPAGFGDQPEAYHSDVIFLMGVDVTEALQAFNPRDGVDTIWPGDGVIYSQRLSAERTKSRLSTIMASPLYKAMTIRSWNTTIKLAALSGQAHNR